jgi:hypothetical protein
MSEGGEGREAGRPIDTTFAIIGARDPVLWRCMPCRIPFRVLGVRGPGFGLGQVYWGFRVLGVRGPGSGVRVGALGSGLLSVLSWGLGDRSQAY